ncbi:hypothetical protein L1049_001944 [Liquidambar formosana]|uniref:Uncharacterized protein n=1 Tax=Liquidambar formosana TaxID=63359 RepID=A0AAP0NF29_LIQFO
METETRSAPDLSLVSATFLCATMNGASETASVDDVNSRATITQIRASMIRFAMDDDRSFAILQVESMEFCRMGKCFRHRKQLGFEPKIRAGSSVKRSTRRLVDFVKVMLYESKEKL